MDFFSHILWTHIPFRNKLWHDEAILFAMLPDLGFLLIFIYALFGSDIHSNLYESMETTPQILMNFYFLLHSFVTLFAVALVLWKFKPKLLPAISGWFIHLCLDIPFHESTFFATRFLYPISSDIYVTGITWISFEIVALNYLTMAGIYIMVLRRELKKQRAGRGWKPDWIDKLDAFGAAIIRGEVIRVRYGAGPDIAAAPSELPGEDQDGLGKIEDSGA